MILSLKRELDNILVLQQMGPAVEAAFDGTEMRLLVEKYHRDSGHKLVLFRS